MTDSGICDSASYDVTRLTRQLAFELRPAWRRTICYPWSWETVIGSARDVAKAGTATLVVFNTEAWGGVVDDLDGMAISLESFLAAADGAVAAIEPGNELDTPGWTDSRGDPITDELIIAVGQCAAEVCDRYGVLCLSPSLLTGPGEGRFERVAKGLANHVDAMAVHPYYRSVGDLPRLGWRFGSLEEAAEECADLGAGLPTWFTEAGCPTIFDGIGEQGQADFTRALRRFQHPNIPVVFQFALHDGVGHSAEIAEGKDWGLIAADGRRKASFAAFAGAAPRPADPPPVITPVKELPKVLTIEECYQLRWQAIVPDAEYHHEFGLETAWRAHPEWGSPVTKGEVTLEDGLQARVFVNAIVAWGESGAEVLAA